MQPRDAPSCKELTFFLHKEVTNPYSEMKENNQSQNYPKHMYNWLKECSHM